ncbi:excinuclease ABC subunit UvrA [Bacteroidales bacterium OttesenSCG-928-B11]|nr:excinuclease ABC subunit UvrA [Bacteroidales bacterium OttesenSCG-928-E04]MDL2311254.1 excinuclease ABC subunit UvrA [Bacteroidales bacterium OttesenSCG-928-B11]
MSDGFIEIKGAKVNNLKNIDVEIPRNQLIVITGLSGSGKTSLAFDTLYAEGQRRYVESLSSYARQFMGKISKPEVEYIKGIPPAIAIEQKVISRNLRSTVGTTSEIYEYLKLLFARIGKTHSPVSGKEVKRHNVGDVMQYVQKQPTSSRIYILSPIHLVSGRNLNEQLEILQKQGFNKIMYYKKVVDIEELLPKLRKANQNTNVFLLIDRIKAESVAGNLTRLADSIQIAFKEGKGECVIQVEDESISQKHFSNLFELDGIAFEEPSLNLFSFNNPYGACKKCGGSGVIDGISPDLVIPDPSLSVYDGGVVCWRGEKMGEWQKYFILNAGKKGFPAHRAIEDLSPEEYELLWNGDEPNDIYGINHFFKFVENNIYKIQYRVMQSRYRGRTVCPECHGTHLRADANYVKIRNKSITDIVTTPIDEVHDFFSSFKYKSQEEAQIATHIIHEIVKRTGFLVDVGLGYLTLNRGSRTLSGGESQRINLATALGSSLVGSLYILDEPSIGLHCRDTANLIKVLERLRDIGNTVVVVEHDEDIIRKADYIIDIGPKAGRLGGNVVFKGVIEDLLKGNESLTAEYLRGMENPNAPDTRTIPLPERRRKWRNSIEIVGAKEHNLKNINVKIPLEVFVVVTGVSGSGKTTLIRNILYPALQRQLDGSSEAPGKHTRIEFDPNTISEVVMVDQNPIGRSSRSNPVTYIKAYDDIRELYASQPLAKQRNYKSSFFSMNVNGGRCEECQGDGFVNISMQFMADIQLECPECEGKRFKDEVLDVKVDKVAINEVLDMTINQAVDFFENIKDSKPAAHAVNKLKYLQEVGLGYLKLGQSSSTLSNGEAQRVKLAYYLSHENSTHKSLFIFDEPTTGLHFHDINKLYQSFNKLIEQGNSIIVIEHNPEIIKCADWIIDLGPEGGSGGGNIVFEGLPEKIVKVKKSYTGRCLEGKVK